MAAAAVMKGEELSRLGQRNKGSGALASTTLAAVPGLLRRGATEAPRRSGERGSPRDPG